MKKKLAVLFAIVLASTSFTAYNSQTNIEEQGEEVLNENALVNENVPVNDTLVVATGAMNGVFNSFFVSNSYDSQVIDMVQAPVCLLDKNG